MALGLLLLFTKLSVVFTFFDLFPWTCCAIKLLYCANRICLPWNVIWTFKACYYICRGNIGVCRNSVVVVPRLATEGYGIPPVRREFLFLPTCNIVAFRGTITSHYQGHNRSQHHLGLLLFWRKLSLFLRSPCGVMHGYHSSAASRVHGLRHSLLVEWSGC